MMAKNCKTCKHLAWHDADTDGMFGPNSGYSCEKRIGGGYDRADTILLAKLESETYLNRGKRCHEPKGGAA